MNIFQLSAKIFCILLAMFVVFPVLSLWAQEDGSSVQVPPTQTVSSRAATSTSSIPEIGASLSPGGSLLVPTTSESATSTSTPIIPAVSPANLPTNNQPILSITEPGESSNGNMIIVEVIAGLVVLVGYGAYKLKTQKNNAKKGEDEKKDDQHCFDLKKLMEEKLEELTDLKGQLKAKAGGMARQHIKEKVKGTTAADAIAFAERVEKEYARFKQLYEKCMFESSAAIKGAKALVVHKGKFLFILRDNKPEIRNPNIWNAPGGRVEKGETWEECLRRELQEEICVVPKKILYIGKRYFSTPGATIACFLVLLDDAEREQIKLGNEGQKLDFFTPDEIMELPLADTKDYFVSIYPVLVRIANGETHFRPEELYLE